MALKHRKTLLLVTALFLGGLLVDPSGWMGGALLLLFWVLLLSWATAAGWRRGRGVGFKVLGAAALVLLGLTLIVPCAICGFAWDASENRGFTFGYYGEFNSVQYALEQLPGVTIKRSGFNPDITLEEFVFVIETAGSEVKLWFLENDALRELSGDELQTALSQRIAGELRGAEAR